MQQGTGMLYLQASRTTKSESGACTQAHEQAHALKHTRTRTQIHTHSNTNTHKHSNTHALKHEHKHKHTNLAQKPCAQQERFETLSCAHAG